VPHRRNWEAGMKALIPAGALSGALGAGAYAQGTGSQDAPKRPRKGSTDTQAAGHTAPKPQPPTEAAPPAPEGQVQLGSVHIPKAVKADGKPLPAGTYQLRVTAETATQDAKGQTKSL